MFSKAAVSEGFMTARSMNPASKIQHGEKLGLCSDDLSTVIATRRALYVVPDLQEVINTFHMVQL